MNYNWNWGIFFQTSPDGVHTYLETLLLGTSWTLATALSGIIVVSTTHERIIELVVQGSRATRDRVNDIILPLRCGN